MSSFDFDIYNLPGKTVSFHSYETHPNEIANAVLPLYEEKIKIPDNGKSVYETYDLNTFKPTEEWERIYHEVRQEAIDLGTPLNAS